ncbi:MAG: hypothetical protein HFE95_05380 [Acutalibacter sp.]|jgi:hypothetical protein|nr:hypothetical protein [Acutalibacter sp.]
MSDVLSIIFSILLVAAIVGLGALGLWFAFGRKKHGEDKAVGVLEPMAHFKATTMMDGMFRRIR